MKVTWFALQIRDSIFVPILFLRICFYQLLNSQSFFYLYRNGENPVSVHGSAYNIIHQIRMLNKAASAVCLSTFNLYSFI